MPSADNNHNSLKQTNDQRVTVQLNYGTKTPATGKRNGKPTPKKTDAQPSSMIGHQDFPEQVTDKGSRLGMLPEYFNNPYSVPMGSSKPQSGSSGQVLQNPLASKYMSAYRKPRSHPLGNNNIRSHPISVKSVGS